MLFERSPWESRAFPGGPVGENPRGHGFDPWSKKVPRAVEQLNLGTTTTEARVPRAHAPKQEKPLQWESRTSQ